MKYWIIQNLKDKLYRVIAENNVAVSMWETSIFEALTTDFTELDPTKSSDMWDSRYQTLDSETVIEPPHGHSDIFLVVVASFNTKPTLKLVQAKYPELLL